MSESELPEQSVVDEFSPFAENAPSHGKDASSLAFRDDSECAEWPGRRPRASLAASSTATSMATDGNEAPMSLATAKAKYQLLQTLDKGPSLTESDTEASQLRSGSSKMYGQQFRCSEECSGYMSGEHPDCEEPSVGLDPEDREPSLMLEDTSRSEDDEAAVCGTCGDDDSYAVCGACGACTNEESLRRTCQNEDCTAIKVVCGPYAFKTTTADPSGGCCKAKSVVCGPGALNTTTTNTFGGCCKAKRVICDSEKCQEYSETQKPCNIGDCCGARKVVCEHDASKTSGDTARHKKVVCECDAFDTSGDTAGQTEKDVTERKTCQIKDCRVRELVCGPKICRSLRKQRAEKMKAGYPYVCGGKSCREKAKKMAELAKEEGYPYGYSSSDVKTTDDESREIEVSKESRHSQTDAEVEAEVRDKEVGTEVPRPVKDKTEEKVPAKTIIPEKDAPDGYYPPEGFKREGYTREGVTPDGVTSKGVTPKGVTPKGVTPKEVTPKGVTPKGVTPKGVTPKGVSPKGVTPKGVTPKGVTPKGVTPKEVTPKGEKLEKSTTDRGRGGSGVRGGRGIRGSRGGIGGRGGREGRVGRGGREGRGGRGGGGGKVGTQDATGRPDMVKEHEFTRYTMETSSRKSFVDKTVRSDLVDYREPTLTGYCRDQRRRVDMVLVVADSGNADVELAKRAFLRNCLGAGLEFELEMGVLKKNSQVVFVKVHAPDAVLLAAAGHYGLRKYFRENHLEMMEDRVLDEQDIIKVVRRNYPGPFSYSTMDRINVVYRLLRHIPFGPEPNFRGVDVLVEQKVIEDIYPLHDGPYFTIDQNPYKMNGRQALFENWVGSENILRRQPVNTIREYLGERIGFLFAFFEFYNRALRPLALAGALLLSAGLSSPAMQVLRYSVCHNHSFSFPQWLVATRFVTARLFYTESYMFTHKNGMYTYYDILRWRKGKDVVPYNKSMFKKIYRYYSYWSWWTRKWKTWYEYLFTGTMTKSIIKVEAFRKYAFTVYTDLPICPKCSDFKSCPFINMTKYCEEMMIKTTIDNPYSLFVALVTVVWTMCLALFWRKKENYFYWLWEVREDAADWQPRPEFKPKIYMHTIKSACQGIVYLFMLMFYWMGLVPTVIVYEQKTSRQLAYLYRNQENLIRGHYFTLAMVCALNAFLVLGVEVIFTKMAFLLNRSLADRRFERQYETQLVYSLFGLTLLVNFGFISFFAFLKGAMYTFPSDERRWYLPLGLGTANCGLLSCIDELLVALLATHVCKKCYVEFDLMFQSHLSEYEQSMQYNQNVPCWEKEKDLAPFNEADVLKKYNYIMTQLVVGTIFAFVFPVAGAVLYLVNVFDIRAWAKLVLLHSRRPLPLKTWGMGAWRRVFAALPFLVGMTNIVALARLSSLLPRLLHQWYFPHSRFFVDYAMGFFNTSDFLNSSSADSAHAAAAGPANGSAVAVVSPAEEWLEYELGRLNRDLYPHWQRADFCLFPNMFSRRYKSYRLQQVVENSYSPNLNYWQLMWSKLLLVIIFQQLVVLLAVALQLLSDSVDARVRVAADVERAVAAAAQRNQDHRALRRPRPRPHARGPARDKASAGPKLKTM